MDEVWRAGRKQANAEEQTNSRVTPKRMSGLPEVPSTHLADSLVQVRLSRTPAARPLPTLTVIDKKTIHNMSLRCAPSAMRIPNSRGEGTCCVSSFYL